MSDPRVRRPVPVEVRAVRALVGVGGDREWWIWNEEARVGHLRVPVTAQEFTRIPAGMAEHHAGDTGPERPRTSIRIPAS